MRHVLSALVQNQPGVLATVAGMLNKVTCAAPQRPEVFQLSESFRGRITDIQHNNVMIEISGTEGKVEAFIALMRPYGILELARTGRIALVRGDAQTPVAPEGT